MNLFINNSTDELAYGESGSDWVQVDPVADFLIFSEGSDVVADGESIPEETALNRAATQLNEDNDVDVSKYFLADDSDNTLKEIKNAGNQDKQYAFCCVFDEATASEPQLEAWDNSDMSTYNDPSLGSGIPSASWYKAVNTNSGSPGADWTGTSLAGSGASNILLLNDGNGGLTEAGELYFNFKIVIPGGYLVPALHTPILVITYATN